MESSAAPPAALGGTIADGTYFSVQSTTYDDANGVIEPGPNSWTIVIRGEEFISTNCMPIFEEMFCSGATATFQTIGTTLLVYHQCPNTTTAGWEYSVLGNRLHIYMGEVGNGPVDEHTLERQ